MRFRFGSRKATTLIEVVLVIGLIAAISGVIIMNLVARKGKTELDTATRQIAALLREAQSRSMAQASSTAWGVHFDNSTSTAPSYSLYHTSYSESNRLGYYRLPAGVDYVSANLADGASRDILFLQLTGKVGASDSIQIYQTGNSANSSTISVAQSGAVSF
ncbi:MAG: hypothetical protein UY99_C0011G0025 [Parcubacteria group bacterium GW2011_GWA1_59_11]|nr:MAG: hypothetical protein UY99_C0011G0025 [Parcubacteria group bacterium GW2011_GWA1_59_11]